MHINDGDTVSKMSNGDTFIQRATGAMIIHRAKRRSRTRATKRERRPAPESNDQLPNPWLAKPLTRAQRKRAGKICHALREVIGVDAGQFQRGFLVDERDLQFFEAIARTYKRYVTLHRSLTLADKQMLYWNVMD